ncbi:peptidylprolyl isomerase [Neisseria sp. N95_16]|uniref:Peptidylprolyl isomerase n=1 Tax=Neisseria brasiliensis TaxID=2666100 RepID=A0A5Q3RXU6_9NEIS|nr:MULTISPECIES: peptidylprolyl isomerase [Neisseria]MRN37936.1 peptidylprolyl isomerase [Neisseria brasiliensis]PJO08640.1 peptidylprolyl isomerase [Neisseria sp. N95_16]PJO78047.1 peptidylprolyl isomerase [Neisseria sp. N177_16]QGL24882.1 peptidylprolyl isomerase [Neisseria brasiliensis]
MNVKPLMLAVVLGLNLNAAHAADVKASDSIAAVVDNDIITQRQVSEALADARRNLPKGTQVTDTELRQQVVAQMVNQSLIVQAGKRRGIQASEAEIDAVIAQNPSLKNANKRVRREIGDSIIVEKVRQQAIMENSRVSDSEVTSFINRAQQQGVALPEGEPLRQYNAQHILIKADSDNAAAAAESSIRKIYAQARSGADFAGLARQYSQDGSAANGGNLGWFSDGMMVTPFEDAVHKLKPGQVSAPVRTQFGWHIIKLNDIREAGTPEERQRNAVRQYISQQKAQQATTNLLRELHSSSFVDIR